MCLCTTVSLQLRRAMLQKKKKRLQDVNPQPAVANAKLKSRLDLSLEPRIGEKCSLRLSWLKNNFAFINKDLSAMAEMIAINGSQ